MLTEKNIRRRARRLLNDAHDDALVVQVIVELANARAQPSTDLPYIPHTGRNAAERNRMVEYGIYKANNDPKLKNDAARQQATAEYFGVDLRTVQRAFSPSTKEQTIETSSAAPAVFTAIGGSTDKR
jgi:hypothetical protein